jgi:hypothetical protein
MAQDEPQKTITFIVTDKFDNGDGNLEITKFLDEGNTYVTKQYSTLSVQQKAIYDAFYVMVTSLT